MNYEILHQISEMNPEVGVTITMDTYPRPQSKSKQNEIVLKNILKQAEVNLLEQCTKREAESVLENLKKINDTIDLTEDCHGIVIFVSSDFSMHYRLPFHPGNRIKIGNKFATRTLIRALEHGEFYYLLTLSKKEVRLYEAYMQTIQKEIKDDSFPFTDNRYYETDRLKRSFASSTDKTSQQFFRQAEEVLLEYYKKEPLPIIIASAEEAFANYKNIEQKEKMVIGHIRGNYDAPTNKELQNLAEKAWVHIQEFQLEQQVQSIERVDKAYSSDLLETDLFRIYDFAIAGQVKELYIEESYFESAVINKDGHLVSKANDGTPVDDAVNEVIHEVLKRGGYIAFVDPYLLGESKCIAAILRWRN